MSLSLYYHPLSSFCWKVLIGLYENGTSFEKRGINLGDPTEKAALEQVWPLGKFPAIRDQARGRDLAESSIIIEYLDHFYPGTQPLIPKTWEAAFEVRLWDRIFDNHVQGPLQQIVTDRLRNTNLDRSKERATLKTAYRMIDLHLASRTWISQEGFSLADCAAAPALFYTTTLEPIPAELGHLGGYFERLCARASVQRVIAEARPYFHMYPFVENIPARFR